MAAFCSREWWSDARHYQIAALSTLLDLQPRLARFRRAAAQQRAGDWRRAGNAGALHALFALPQFDPRSPLITGLSLSLLLRADEPWLHALAGVIAIGSKFVLRIDGKHIWNPAGFAIVVLLFTSNGVWISPGTMGLDGLVRGAARASSPSWCCTPRAAPTSRSSFSAAMRRCCSRAPGGSATRSRSRCISCRAARC